LLACLFALDPGFSADGAGSGFALAQAS